MEKVNKEIIDQILDLANGSDIEIVGCIYQEDNNLKVHQMINHAENKKEFFLMLNDPVYANLLINNQIIAIYHSHNDQSIEPSELDRIQQKFSALPWLIVSNKIRGYRWLP